MTEDQVRNSLACLGSALNGGNPVIVADYWELPALVLDDVRATPVTTPADVEQYFAQTIDAYRQSGVISTRPVVERIDVLSEALAAVDVRWTAFDNEGVRRSTAYSHYVMHIGEDGKARIRVALRRTA